MGAHTIPHPCEADPTGMHAAVTQRMRTYALATILALGGCVTDQSDLDCDDGKCDGNGGLFNTINGNTLLYGGFHTLFDKTSSQCVQPQAGAGGAQINVGSLSESIDLTAITSRE